MVYIKILHVISQLPAKTGSGVFYTNLIEGFKKHGHEQKAIFGCQDGYMWDNLEQNDQIPIVFKSEMLPFPIVGMSDTMPYENTKYSDMNEEMLEKYIAVFKSNLEIVKATFNPDIILAHHLWIVTALAREVFIDKKIIGICHNTDLRQAKLNSYIKRKYVYNIDQLDYIFSASKHQNNEIVNIYGIDESKIISVGGGFNQNIFYQREKKEYSDKIRMIFCGKIDQSKGIYQLIEVYNSLKLDDVTLDIFGALNEENKKKIKEYVNSNSNINLYSEIDQITLGDEFRKRDIYLMPSYYEGLGLTAIESLACGLYVVATEIPSLKSMLGERITESGVIQYVQLPRMYDVDKPLEEDLMEFKENLKKAILIQIQKIRLKDEFEVEIKELLKSFSWENVVDNINKFILSI